MGAGENGHHGIVMQIPVVLVLKLEAENVIIHYRLAVGKHAVVACQKHFLAQKAVQIDAQWTLILVAII